MNTAAAPRVVLRFAGPAVSFAAMRSQRGRRARSRSAWIVRRLGPVGLGLVALAPLACVPRDVPSQPAAAPQAPPAFTVTALPVYRLAANRALLDAPSRLLVVDVRLSTIDEAPLQFFPEDLSVALPGGGRGIVFDPARAHVLLSRTLLAEADLGYLQRADPQPGGIPAAVRPQLAAMVGQHLLGSGTFAAGSALRGYVVIDTVVPLRSLDGAAVEVVARRLDDAAPARYAYQFTAAVPAEEGR